MAKSDRPKAGTPQGGSGGGGSWRRRRRRWGRSTAWSCVRRGRPCERRSLWPLEAPLRVSEGRGRTESAPCYPELYPAAQATEHRRSGGAAARTARRVTRSDGAAMESAPAAGASGCRSASGQRRRDSRLRPKYHANGWGSPSRAPRPRANSATRDPERPGPPGPTRVTAPNAYCLGHHCTLPSDEHKVRYGLPLHIASPI